MTTVVAGNATIPSSTCAAGCPCCKQHSGADASGGGADSAPVNPLQDPTQAATIGGGAGIAAELLPALTTLTQKLSELSAQLQQLSTTINGGGGTPPPVVQPPVINPEPPTPAVTPPPAPSMDVTSLAAAGQSVAAILETQEQTLVAHENELNQMTQNGTVSDAQLAVSIASHASRRADQAAVQSILGLAQSTGHILPTDGTDYTQAVVDAANAGTQPSQLAPGAPLTQELLGARMMLLAMQVQRGEGVDTTEVNALIATVAAAAGMSQPATDNAA